MNELNIKLKTLRKEQGYTQEQLADILNLARSSISNYENGINEPSISILVAIADLYNVSLDWLTGRTKTRYNSNLYIKDNIENIDVITSIYEVLKDFEITKK